MARAKKQERKPWQRRANASRQWNPIYNDLLDSPAFHDLTPSQKVLYFYCQRETHGDAMRDSGTQDERVFFMNRALRCKTHQLYPLSDTRAFERDMAQLVGHGFVDCLQSGLDTRTKSLYRLSARWCDWGTPAFSMPERLKTLHMQIAEGKQLAAQRKAQAAAETEGTCAGAPCLPAAEQED